MSQVNTGFKAAEIGAKIKGGLSRLDNLLAQSKNDGLSAIRTKLRDQLKEYQAQGAIRVAFVGQYMISTSWHTGGSSSSCSRQRIVLLLRLFLVMVGSTPTVAGFVIAKEV